MPRMNAAERIPHHQDDGQEHDPNVRQPSPKKTRDGHRAKPAEIALRDKDLTEISEAEARRIEAEEPITLRDGDLQPISESEAREIRKTRTVPLRRADLTAISAQEADKIENVARLSGTDLEEINEAEAREIEAVKRGAREHGDVIAYEAEKTVRQMAARAEQERRRVGQDAEAAREAVDMLALEQEREELRKAEEEDLRQAERRAIDELHTQRINRQLDAQEQALRMDTETRTKPQAKIASRWERAKKWLRDRLGA